MIRHDAQAALNTVRGNVLPMGKRDERAGEEENCLELQSHRALKSRAQTTQPQKRGCVELPTEYDSDDEEVKKAKAERGPKRSVALKIAARRVLDSDPPPLPMARHKVQGAHGLEYHKVVDISAIQSSCEQLGGNISVEQMLGRRRQREEREQEQERVRREQEQSRWLHNSSARTLSWEERQEQVMLRRRQHRQEEAYRRLAATREARKLVKGAGLDGDLSPTMGALLRDMPSKLKEEEERDGV
ncbi:hypothetical protein AK812_SmicGene8491 [Symbiodinium microadriaticum]|uniref:Uncharacterized protein n=1 Tax=Symbiodinium microadriaticum TaxID=2951 RepID=A0A1Q9EKT1_SYMMI|nr:hypothetical protein AK812_SmicGene8491 [Symbiodinium microadriaticum]